MNPPISLWFSYDFIVTGPHFVWNTARELMSLIEVQEIVNPGCPGAREKPLGMSEGRLFQRIPWLIVFFLK